MSKVIRFPGPRERWRLPRRSRVDEALRRKELLRSLDDEVEGVVDFENGVPVATFRDGTRSILTIRELTLPEDDDSEPFTFDEIESQLFGTGPEGGEE